MNLPHSSPVAFPFRLESPSGLSVQVNANGSVRRMDCRDFILNLFLGTEMEGGPANLYLRRHGASIDVVPLLGPASPATFSFEPHRMTAAGQWQGIRFQVSLALADSAPAWFWHVNLNNTRPAVATLDLIYCQDLALAHYWAVRMNEYYVSHYVDHTPLSHPRHGILLASRQNQSMGGCNPWTLIGALGQGVSYATDALQVHGLATRAGSSPPALANGLPGYRRQHEHSMAALQHALVHLEPGASCRCGFFGWFEAHHPAATCADDLAFVDKIMALPEATPSGDESRPVIEPAPAKSLFCSAPLVDALELTENEINDLFGTERREEEREQGRLLSFFTGSHGHVVLKTKELTTLRPHGHILRTGDRLVPDEASLTSTVWMAGVFHSMVTQGHVSINRFLSTARSYLGLLRGNGQRLFVEIEEAWHLLDVPSAFEMTPQTCRWIYKHPGGLIAVQSEARLERHELTLSAQVLAGPATRFLLSSHIALNGDDGSDPVPVRFEQDHEGLFVRPIPDSDVGRRFPEGGFRIAAAPGTALERVGTDEVLFADGCSRNQPYLCLVTAPSTSVGFLMKGCLVPESPRDEAAAAPEQFWRNLTAGFSLHPPEESPQARAASRCGELLPWLIHNALVHYLSPRGLEQFTGGGWGTRDVCQGPVEMLLALGRFEAVRDLLVRVFRTQNPDGDWPQWFMFFERERNIRPGDSHGDIVFWPVLALAQYLNASEDTSVLDEPVPFFHPEGDEKAERATLWHHVDRALAVMNSRVIAGTRLAAYGNGDWNDSLQPVQPAMREHLSSAWTVTLHHQTLLTLAATLSRLGLCDRAAGLEAMATKIRGDFQRLLIVDETLTGLAYFLEDGRIDYLLHPRDQATGISYSLLPMIHAIINDLLTPEQARHHLDLIKNHLLGPDGARLFDRPLEYRGGLQHYFQRAESAAFFGREIGLMYTHAHLRYAEALAHYGDADGFFLALSQANPIALRTLVPAATLRQANCYYSSSDAAFADRYQAFTEYDRLHKGEIPLDGGWRVYSSGAGIMVRLILQCFLGLRLGESLLVVDPVVPKSLDGLRVEWELARRRVDIVYHVEKAGCGPMKVACNGKALPFARRVNPYRIGAAEVPMVALEDRLNSDTNRIEIWLG